MVPAAAVSLLLGGLCAAPAYVPRLVAVALVALTVVASSSSQVEAIPTTAGGPVAASTLFACGSNGDVTDQTKEVADLFKALKSVCCNDMQEQCDAAKTVPETCTTVECARAVDIVAQSCAASFAADGFVRMAFKPSLDLVVAACGAAQPARSDHTPTYVITDHGLQASPIKTCHGRLVDGATSGFPVAITGQDAVVFQAPKGMQIKVSAQTTCFSPTANIHIYDGPDQSAPELGVLRGASLDTREFVSSKGVLRVMRAVDLGNDAGLPLIFSLDVGCTCKDGDNCGAHGSCVSGTCQCDDGYSGGMCENVDDPCDAIDCGTHGSCVSGTCQCDDGYSGGMCEHLDDPCAAIHINCGAYGRCNENTLRCECLYRYTGPTCEQAPARCCDVGVDAACCWTCPTCLGGDGCFEYCDAHHPGWDSEDGPTCDRSC